MIIGVQFTIYNIQYIAPSCAPPATHASASDVDGRSEGQTALVCTVVFETNGNDDENEFDGGGGGSGGTLSSYCALAPQLIFQRRIPGYSNAAMAYESAPRFSPTYHSHTRPAHNVDKGLPGDVFRASYAVDSSSSAPFRCLEAVQGFWSTDTGSGSLWRTPAQGLFYHKISTSNIWYTVYSALTIELSTRKWNSYRVPQEIVVNVIKVGCKGVGVRRGMRLEDIISLRATFFANMSNNAKFTALSVMGHKLFVSTSGTRKKKQLPE
ncbi:hypothetical protein BJ912DRAFT_927016 [Pholiota molesta]|nr:hypothetical protein BJ912DRAFT_927016 [Pholiota molesta]